MSQDFNKEPQVFCDSWSKSVQTLQPCHLPKNEGTIDEKQIYPKINHPNVTAENTGGVIKNTSKMEVSSEVLFETYDDPCVIQVTRGGWSPFPGLKGGAPGAQVGCSSRL